MQQSINLTKVWLSAMENQYEGLRDTDDERLLCVMRGVGGDNTLTGLPIPALVVLL